MCASHGVAILARNRYGAHVRWEILIASSRTFPGGLVILPLAFNCEALHLTGQTHPSCNRSVFHAVRKNY